MAGIVVLYLFLFSSFESIVYMFKTGELKVIQDNDSCQINFRLFFLNESSIQNLFGIKQIMKLYISGLFLPFHDKIGKIAQEKVAQKC